MDANKRKSILEALHNDPYCRSLEPNCGYGEPLDSTTCAYCTGICSRPSLAAMPKDAYDPEDGPYYESIADEDFVRMQALCYAFVQAEDAICVISKYADCDDAVHSEQVKALADVIAEYYDHFSPAQQRTIVKECFWFDEYIIEFAAGKVKER